MANTLYDNARVLLLTGGINWSSDTIAVVLVNTSAYTLNASTHVNLSDIPTSARVGGTSGVNLSSKATTGGAADAADTTFSAVSGSTVGALVIYQVGAAESSSPLIAYIDTATGLPITPNGGDIICTWDNGVNKIFRP